MSLFLPDCCNSRLRKAQARTALIRDGRDEGRSGRPDALGADGRTVRLAGLGHLGSRLACDRYFRRAVHFDRGRSMNRHGVWDARAKSGLPWLRAIVRICHADGTQPLRADQVGQDA